MRPKNVKHYESYITNIDMDFDADDTIVSGYNYKLNKPEINNVNRSEYGTRTDFWQDFLEFVGHNCYNPTSGFCLIKYINYLTGKDYKQRF